MTLPIDAWVPVPMRWRHIRAGDVFVGKGDRLWHVIACGPRDADQLHVRANSSADGAQVDVSPDEVIDVLIPVPERDAVELTREELGARLIARRTAPQS